MIRRISAIFLRQLYLYRHSLHRFFSLFYWPALELFLWGFLTVYLNRLGGAGFNFASIFLGAVIFWNFFHRAEQSVSVSFLEDVWARNVGNIFASPIRPWEFLAALLALSVMQTLLSLGFLAVLAALLWRFDIFHFGFWLLPFFLNLYILAWSIGIVSTAVLLRLGPSFEIFAWSLPFLIQPLSAVFYPVSVLPPVLQKIAWLLPTTHVFEGMRAVILGQGFSNGRMFLAFFLNVLYFMAALLFFHLAFRSVRKKGLLQRHSEY